MYYKILQKFVIDWPVLAALSGRRISWQPCTTARAKYRARSRHIRLWRMWPPRSRWLGTSSDAYGRLVGSAEYHKHCTNIHRGLSVPRAYDGSITWLQDFTHSVAFKKMHIRVSETTYVPVLEFIPSDQTPYVIPPTLHLRTQTDSVSKRLGGRRGSFLNTRRWT